MDSSNQPTLPPDTLEDDYEGKNIINFFKKLKVVGSCLVWEGMAVRGYGVVHVKNKIYKVHRFWYQLKGNKLLKADVLHHKCFNKLCVNPDHLEKMGRAEHTRLHKTLGALKNAKTP